MSNSLLELGNGLSIGIEVADAVPLAIEVTVTLKSIVAVNRDEKLDAIVMGLCHEVVKPVQNSIVPVIRTCALQAIEAVDGRALCIARLA